MKTTLREQLEAFDEGRIIDSEGNENSCYNFYDWFCRDTGLKNKSINLFKKIKKFLKHYPDIDLDQCYVFFKNNCPVSGSLYDDFRICDEEKVLFTVIPKSGHTGKAEIWGFENKFEKPLKKADTWRELFK